VQRANDVISEQVPDGGTTVTAAAVMGGLAYIAHVGDSRAYLVSEERIEHVTRDHSLVQRLIELDQLTPEDALEHPQRNVLYRALGQSDNLDVDAITRQISPGGYLLICSDGLWNLVSNEEIQQIVLEHQDNTQLSCQKLVALANERGGSDNITVILVRVPG
jgi:protein phosphatase